MNRDVLRSYAMSAEAYRPNKNATFRTPIGPAEFCEWLRVYILQLIVFGVESGKNGDALREAVNDARLHAVRTHNAKRPDDLYWQLDSSHDELWMDARLKELHD